MNESVRCLPPRVTLRWTINRGGILQSIVMPDASARRSAHRRHSWSGQDGAETLQVGVVAAARSGRGSVRGCRRPAAGGAVGAGGGGRVLQFARSRVRSGAGRWRATGGGRRAVADCPRLGSVDRLRAAAICARSPPAPHAAARPELSLRNATTNAFFFQLSLL